MSNSLSKILSYGLYVLLAISVVFTIFFYFGEIVPGTEGTNLEEPVITKSFLTWAFILGIIAAGTTLLFSFIQMFSSRKNAIRAAIVIAIFAVIILISYSLASDEVLHIVGYKGKDNVPDTLKWVGTGLNTMVILFALAVLALLYTGISRIFK